MRSLIFFMAFIAVLSNSALGHHGNSEFDLGTQYRVNGTPDRHHLAQPVYHSHPILFTSEWLGAQRTIYTDGRGHPPMTERFQQGHAIGQWEGETFEIDTTNFSDQETGGVPSGSQRHLAQRFFREFE